MTAVCGFGVLTPVTEDSSEPAWPALVASMPSIVDFTSADVKVEPSVNLTPCRRVKVVERPSAEVRHDVASHGMVVPWGVLQTSGSYRLRVTVNESRSVAWRGSMWVGASPA